MRRIKLIHITAAVWIALLAVVITYRDELAWAARALPAQINEGDFPDQIHWRLYEEADEAWRERHDAKEAIALLKRSLAIEPNSDPMFMLAEIQAATGDADASLAQYLRVVEFDATYVDAYLRAAELYEERGDRENAIAIVRKGRDYFRSQAERFQPHTDPSAPSRENEKAEETYDEYRKGLKILESRVGWLGGE